jgi:hypothetical protein
VAENGEIIIRGLETNSMLEEIMTKIGLLVGGSMLHFEKIPEMAKFVSDNLPARLPIRLVNFRFFYIYMNKHSFGKAQITNRLSIIRLFYEPVLSS